MARRNRKRVRADHQFFPAPIAAALVIVCSLGVGYVCLLCQCESVGKDIKRLENENKLAMNLYANEQSRWSQAKAPQNLEAALRQYNIDMAWPQPGQVVQMRDVYVPYEDPGPQDAYALKATRGGRVP
jgi:hypothetical protein